MDEAALIDAWKKEETEPFRGWDFSHIAGRVVDEKPPWSYEEMARDVLRAATSAVDLGTGGGELLSRLRDAFPPRVVATEAYAPNVRVAYGRLRPLGATVVAYGADERSAPLPFRDAAFDAVLARHEAYEAREVARVLARRGVFLTQQVAWGSLADLLRHFGAAPQWPHVTLERFAHEIRAAGLVIEDARSWWGSMTFLDVGALVYYLKAIPWEVPNFSIDGHRPALVDLQRTLERDGRLTFKQGRFVIQARK